MAGLISGHNATAASCSPISLSSTITIPPIVVQRDVPIGTLIGRATLPAKSIYTCSGKTTIATDAGIKAYGTLQPYRPPNNMALYNTNIPGVSYGIIGALDSTNMAGYYFGVEGPDKILNSWSPGDIASLRYGVSLGVELFKTGPTGSGAIPSKKVGAAIIRVDNAWQTEHDLLISSFNVTTLACAISASNISVPLGDVLVTKFTGVGATPVTKGFNLGLNCDANAKVNVSLSGTANSDIANSDILALTNAGTAGVADGLGVQILYNGAPLKRNTNLLLKTSAGGVETLPFSARYFQTKSAVKPGKANASATFNLTYQ